MFTYIQITQIIVANPFHIKAKGQRVHIYVEILPNYQYLYVMVLMMQTIMEHNNYGFKVSKVDSRKISLITMPEDQIM